MLLPIKPVCKSNKVRKDGTSIVFIQYCLDSERRTLLNTEIAVPPKFWHQKKLFILKELPSNFGNVDQLNDQLRKLIRKTEDIVSLALRRKVADPITFLNEFFVQEIDIQGIEAKLKEAELKKSLGDPRLNLNVYFQIDEYIKSKSLKVSPGMLRIYKNMKEHLQCFEAYRKDAITFDSFDLDFYESFINYLSYDYIQKRRKEVIRGLKVNTIGKTIKQLRIFLKNRMRKKIISPIDLEEFKVPEEDVDAIYLTWLEISKIYNLDLTRFPHLIEYRNLFVLACLTGLRFSDFSTLQISDVRNGMLYKKQGKSDGWVVIPLRQEALSLFNNEFREQIPLLTNVEFNRHIKTLGRLGGINELITFSYKKGNKDVVVTKPKYDWITSHTCRRSFCTNEFLAGTPVELIMKISGHKSVKDFYKYIRITPEEAGQKIKELWQQRGEMKLFGELKKKVS